MAMPLAWALRLVSSEAESPLGLLRRFNVGVGCAVLLAGSAVCRPGDPLALELWESAAVAGLGAGLGSRLFRGRRCLEFQAVPFFGLSTGTANGREPAEWRYRLFLAGMDVFAWVSTFAVVSFRPLRPGCSTTPGLLRAYWLHYQADEAGQRERYSFPVQSGPLTGPLELKSRHRILPPPPPPLYWTPTGGPRVQSDIFDFSLATCNGIR